MLNYGTCSSTSDTDDQPLQPHQQADKPWRIVGPTPEQWTNIKDIFTQLYLVENRKLKDVRQILSQMHGFNASEKMYKRRITEWKIRKNYKAKDKEILAKRVKAYVDAGYDVQSMSFHGRPVKLDRVKRHYRTDKRFNQLWERLSQSPEDILIGDVAIKQDSPSAATTRLTPVPNFSSTLGQWSSSVEAGTVPEMGNLTTNVRPPAEMYNIEATLFHTYEAVRWQFTAFTPLKLRDLPVRFPDSIPSEVLAGRVDQVSAFWLALDHGFKYLKTGRSKDAWRSFDESCKMVQPLIVSAPLQLLSCLLLHFATAWQGLNELEQHLLKFTASMTSNVLGPSHPLAQALKMIAAGDVRDQAVEPMMNLVLEGYYARRKPNNSSLFALRVDQIDMLRKRQKFDQARALCAQLIQDSQSMRRKRYRTALAALGRLYEDQNEEFAVEGIAHRILDDEASDRGSSNSGGTTTWACDQLASLCMNRGDYLLAESYLRRATCISYQRYAHRGPSLQSLVKKLESCMHQQGKNVDIYKVCEEMGIQTTSIRH
ncbi:uncharacterized protein Z518_03663 [Rhinocladiella mackenziei CBS 650.93]|uniref:Rhinocladiella mackenziei CBS 650.93 unplaced genomic scaffold supercont1.3, whole genome shotgun sequence n=1 Tax=Rhinocladiella mackenziei CBS 650.93 TaxID=1442369 RepID=A0A0D2IRA1_9EURO|nr:uncharacterized protein Z518_03663 [Rhinocladiella mackenziei CBS 650.93]KIX05691.1 hypothetical protein Z518_03663 [Rhinocladiella mackenziei CBS 650.93]